MVLVVAIATVVRAQPASRTTVQMIAGTPEPGQGKVDIDTTLYLPQHTPAPSILLAQGFGSSKLGLAGQATSLARHGYVVLAYTARGFGRSGGLIHLDAPKYEVADARKLIDYLGTLKTVQQDGADDPRVGVAGASYGGALALLAAGLDRRVDAVAADITWNSLTQALLPNYATANGAPESGGVFKKLWASYLFGSGAPSPLALPSALPTSAGCGRFSAQLCGAYQSLAQGKPAQPATLKLLTESSPATVLGRIHAPTLLSQGEQDSLFPLSEADANARGIARTGTPVSVVWRLGGHDTGSGSATADSAAQKWFDDVLRHGRAPTTFDLTLSGAGISAQNGERVSETLHARAGYPGIAGAAAGNRSVPPGSTGSNSGPQSTAPPDTTPLPQATAPETFAVPVSGRVQTVTAPAGGSPAAISSLPGLSSILGLAGGALGALTSVPGQTAAFESAPAQRQQLVAGSSSVDLSVTAVNARNATLFVAVHDVAPDGTDTLPGQLVNAVRLSGLTPNQARTVHVALPSVLFRLAAGHRLRVTVSTTDQAYLLPSDPRTYRIGLAGGNALQVPTLATTASHDRSPLIWLVAGLLAAVLAVAGATLMGRRPRADGEHPRDDAPPVVFKDLVKEYSDGFRAVDGVSFRVELGQIVGLLGPNGAGKTTALRVLVGLIQPTAGSVEVFGERIRPGVPVLARVGAFIEGPGLLPHLSGRDNLRLYWAASGRPSSEAQFDTALEIAGLGSSIERRVKTYSQGMRQRLALAQSMLGLPELLVLDEPTNGLDPPQIAEMRQVLRSYAGTGRTVVISSHLLAEVEQTCTHVVVMHRGKLVAAGSVADVAGTGSVTLAVGDPMAARRVLAAAGIHASEVPARRALEDVFLELVGD